MVVGSNRSHPSWVCGLKPEISHGIHSGTWSHPSWVCGLKQLYKVIFCEVDAVTPFVGVWIETYTLMVWLASG